MRPSNLFTISAAPFLLRILTLLLASCTYTPSRYVLTDAIRNETALSDSSGNTALEAAAAEAEAAAVTKAAAEAADVEAALIALQLDPATGGAVEEVTDAAAALSVSE